MRKRILCTVLLSLLASVLTAVPALATQYYRMLNVTPSATTYDFTQAYSETKNLVSASIRFDVSMLNVSDDRLPSGFTTDNTITWTVTVDPAAASKDVYIQGTGRNVITVTPAMIAAGTVSASLRGELYRDATITVRAANGDIRKPDRAAKIKITMKDKPDPELNAATKDAEKLLAVLGSAPRLTDENGSFDKTTTSGKFAVTGTAIANLTFINYPESMSVTPPPKYLSDTYGIELKDKIANGSETALKTLGTANKDDTYQLTTATNASNQLADAAKTRTITFGATAASVIRQVDNLPITFNVWNKKADGSAGKKQEFTIYLTIKPLNFPAEKVGTAALFSAQPIADANNTAGRVTLPSDGVKDKVRHSGQIVKDLGSKASVANTDKRAVPQKNTSNDNHPLYGLQMVKVGAAFPTTGNNVPKWTTVAISTPAVIYATGLPKGMKLVQEGTTATTANTGAQVIGHLEGSPEEAGYYDNIKIIVSNDGGVWSMDNYVIDVVEPSLSFTTDELPDMTWGSDYTATVKATSADNKYHPTVFFFDTDQMITYSGSTNNAKKVLRSPGLKLARNTGVLSGKLASSDRALEKVKLSNDYALSGDAEKTVHVIVTISNDWTHADTARGAVKKVSKDISFTLKAIAPKLYETTPVSVQNAINKAGLTVGVEDTTNLKNIITVKGPGLITFEFVNFPDGFVFLTSDDIDNAMTKASMYPTPSMTAKSRAATIKIYNGANKSKPLTIPVKVSVAGKDFKLSWKDSKDINPVKIGEEIDMVAVDAPFGPVKWTAKNLPSGLKLSVDKSISNDARVWIIGAPKTATKVDKNGRSIYTITAVDSDAPKKLEASISQDFVVYPKPKISTYALPAITLDRAYTAKINGSAGTGVKAKDLYWVVHVEEYPLPENQARPASRKTLDSSDTADFALTTTFSVDCEALAPKSYLIVSNDKKTGLPVIEGSLDRMPASGRLKVSLKLTVAKNTSAEESVSNDSIVVTVKGTPAKVENARINQFSRTDTKVSYDVTATGTKPIYMEAKVRAADVRSLLKLSGDIDLTETDPDKNPLGIVFSYDQTALDGKGKLVSTGTGKYSFKNLPVHIRAGNSVTFDKAKDKIVPTASSDKVFKVTMPGITPVWYRSNRDDLDGEISKASSDVTVFGEDGIAITNPVYYVVSADLPYEIKVTPLSRNGIEVSFDNPKLDNGSVVPGWVKISGTPTAGRETKSQFTLLAQNTATKEKSQIKFTVVGEQRPFITTKMDSDGFVADKVIEVGKSMSYRLSARGSKKSYYSPSKDTDNHMSEVESRYVGYSAITWDITEVTPNGLEKLEAIGLSFDRKTGMFKGAATGATSDDNGNYSPLVFNVKPVNSTATPAADKASADVRIGVKGRKFKINTKTISLYRASADQYNQTANMLATNITDDEGAKITWAWADAAARQTADTWGLSGTMTSANNLGKLAVKTGLTALPKATKGVSIKVSADNIGQKVTGTVKFVIKDADPVIFGDKQIFMDSAKDSIEQVTREYTLSNDAAMMTGDTKMLWKVAKTPATNQVKVALKAYSDGTGCTVTVTAAKKVSPDVVKTSFTLSVTNQSTKEVGHYVVSVDVNPYTDSDSEVTALPEDKDAKPEDETELAEDTLSENETLSGDELPAGEGTVTYGEARGESTLTEAERTALSEGGYIIAAILPEITTDESGQYDLEAVSLDEAAPEGYELVWFAFPRRVESSDDDAIAEFYDEAGAEVFAVPEGRKVVPSPWLEKEVTYAPVIAVKAPSAGNAKTSFDQAEEGDTVTVQAIEEAAEKSAEDTAETSDEPEKVSEESKHEEAAEK